MRLHENKEETNRRNAVAMGSLAERFEAEGELD